MLTKNEIKHINELRLKKKRKVCQEFIIEGEKMVAEAMEYCKDRIVKIYCLDSFAQQHSSINEINFTIVDERELKLISELTTPNLAIAILKIEENEISDTAFYLAMDSIQDPGNMGTIIRLADWFGLTEIICSSDCVDVYNPKVVQATMGSIFRISVHYVDLEDFIINKNKPVYGALLDGDNIYKTSLKREGILILGNEGNGIREDLKSQITNPIMIPRFGKAESLNVSMATGIILSEFFRN